MEIPQFEASDLNSIMGWYLTGRVTMQQLADALNIRLREKAEAQQDRPRRVIRPNCF